MADKITTTEELKVEWSFQDGDTRTNSFLNPKDNLTAAQIKAAADKVIQGQIIIGDKASARVVGVNSVNVVETTKTNVDLEYEP